MGVIRRNGFGFGFDPSACSGCPGRCCRGTSGNVWVSPSEILQISGFLETNSIDCIQKYLNRVGNRLSIKERFTGHDFECVFFEGPKKGCSIYPVRPLQCRQFPFWDYFRRHKDQLVKECPGITE
jgi:Fe-S-cluster containining protein